MPLDSQHPANDVGSSTQRKSSGIRQVTSKLFLMVVLILAGTPVVPPPTGATDLLWKEADDLRAGKSYASAIEAYEQIAALSPNDPEALLAIGEIYLYQRRWPLAEDVFNRALARNGKNAKAMSGLATARWEQGDRQRAVSLWETALSLGKADSDLSDIQVHLALAYLDMDRPAEAEAILRDELASRSNPAAHLYLGMMRAIDDPSSARRELKSITNNQSPAMISTRDYLLESLDVAETAGTAAGQAKSMGVAFVQIGEWQLARAALERALQLDPTDAEAAAFLGHAESQLGRPAFTNLAMAVESQPDWPLGHYLLGLFYLNQEAYEFAVEEFKATLRLDPGNAQALADLARAYVGLGHYLEAEEALTRAAKSAPEDLTFHAALVRFYADHTYQVTDRGLAAARAAADLAPEDPQIRDMLGWMHFLAGDPAKARLHLESALGLDPELASAHYHMGVLRNALGEEEAARFAFLRAIDLDTEGVYRRQAQKFLHDMAQAKP
jgi:tetratricopeptide (TPR) repeat protein